MYTDDWIEVHLRNLVWYKNKKGKKVTNITVL